MLTGKKLLYSTGRRYNIAAEFHRMNCKIVFDFAAYAVTAEVYITERSDWNANEMPIFRLLFFWRQAGRHHARHKMIV